MASVVASGGFKFGRVLGRSSAVLLRSLATFTFHAPVLALAGPPMGGAIRFPPVQRLGWRLLGAVGTFA